MKVCVGENKIESDSCPCMNQARSSEGDRLTLQQQSQDLHAWLTGSVGRTSAHKHRLVVSPDSKGTKAMIGMEKSYAD